MSQAHETTQSIAEHDPMPSHRADNRPRLLLPSEHLSLPLHVNSLRAAEPQLTAAWPVSIAMHSTAHVSAPPQSTCAQADGCSQWISQRGAVPHRTFAQAW